jgi:FkbM family methyltransferase
MGYLIAQARKRLRRAGFDIVRFSTNRGICLQADAKRLLGERTNTVICDVGANVGDFSRSLLEAFPVSEIYAFEPIPDTYVALKSSTARFQQIMPFNLALGERNGMAEMTSIHLSGTNRVVDSKQGYSNGHTAIVPMKTLESFAHETGILSIDLLKTDCEGYDINVLSGCGSLLEERKIRLIYCEVNMRSDGCHGDFFAINQLLVSRGYAFYALYDYSGIGALQGESFCNAMWVDNRLPC